MNLETILTLFTEKGREAWAQRTFPVLVLIVISGLLLQFFVAEDLSEVTNGEWFTLGLVCVAVTSFWFYTNRTPKAPKGQAGFGVAIDFEDPRHQVAVRTDLISTLRNLLSEHSTIYPFYLLEFPQRMCCNLDVVAARKLRRKARCKFLIYGVARLREHEGKPLHVFNLAGLVSHAPIRGLQAKQLENEFSTVLQSRHIVKKDADFISFEFTAHWLDIVTRYIVGVAAYHTRD